MNYRRLRINGGFLYFDRPNKRTLKKIAHIPGFAKKENRCRIPNTRTARLLLQSAGYYLYEPPKKLTNPFKGDPTWDRLSKNLRPYQLEGVLYLEARKRILLGDEQGLGKTVQVLSWLSIRPEICPVVIVCPSHLKINWLRETLKWAGEEAEILSGRTPYKTTADILIINYEIVSYWRKALRKMKPKAIAIDECQRIKNRKAKTTQAVKAVAGLCPYIIPISGTPIKNRPEEFYSILSLLAPEEFPSFDFFASLYCDPKRVGHWMDYSGSENTEELYDRLNKRLMIRRLKKDHLKELPEKEIVTVSIEPPQEALKGYRKILSEMITDKQKEANQREKTNWMEKLKQECLRAKLPEVKEWVMDFLESSSEKLILFTTHHETVDYLQEAFKDVCVVVDGRVKGTKRQQAIDDFQEGSARLFIGNLQAASEGLTLTSSSSVAFVELGWSPADHSQGEDRVHRFGQAAEQVTIYYLIVPNTIEDKIWKMLEEKQKVLNEILDGKSKEDATINKRVLFAWLKNSEKRRAA